VRTPAPAVVVAITVAEGDEVAAGDAVAVVEAMKMETVLVAPFAGRVRAVLSGTNVQVDAGTPLLQLEPLDRPAAEGAADAGGAGTDRISLDALIAVAADRDPDPAEADRHDLLLLEWLLLGYDVPDADVARIV